MRSSQLQGAQCNERAEDADDPEAHDDLALIPSALFKMMVQRRKPEDSM
jgi:hypothetical protein